MVVVAGRVVVVVVSWIVVEVEVVVVSFIGRVVVVSGRVVVVSFIGIVVVVVVESRVQFMSWTQPLKVVIDQQAPFCLQQS